MRDDQGRCFVRDYVALCGKSVRFAAFRRFSRLTVLNPKYPKVVWNLKEPANAGTTHAAANWTIDRVWGTYSLTY